jgi:hypothetical protein
MKKPHLSAKILGLLAVFLLLVVLEGFFDWIEIGMGEVMRLTNRFDANRQVLEEEANDLAVKSGIPIAGRSACRQQCDRDDFARSRGSARRVVVAAAPNHPTR